MTDVAQAAYEAAATAYATRRSDSAAYDAAYTAATAVLAPAGRGWPSWEADRIASYLAAHAGVGAPK
jgi:hypothetical protein